MPPGWRFRLLRWYIALWTAWDCEPIFVVPRNFIFWVQRPLLWWRVRCAVRVYREAWRNGREVIEA